MSAEIHRFFPEGLKYAEAERGKPRHDPPLRFVPPKASEKEDGKDKNLKSITVVLNQEMSQKVAPFEFDVIENFLKMQILFEQLLTQQDSKKNWKKHDKSDDAILAKIRAIPDGTTDTKEIVKLEKLNKVRRELQDKMDALVLKAFVLYQQMLAPNTRSEWDDIVQQHCHTKGWTMPDGKDSLEERGREWETLNACLRLHLLTVCKPDSAERHHQYMNVTVRKPWRMTIKTFYKRLKELDALAHMLPCLKDDPDCPLEIVRMNVPLTPVMMCCLLMRVITPAMENEYDCLTDLLPTDPKKLVEQLTKIETKLNEVNKSNPEDRQKEKGKGHPDTPSEQSRSSKKRMLDKAKRENAKDVVARIPRKSTPNKKADKLCKLCEEYGGAKNTHHTSQCKKWAAGGKAHNEWRGPAANLNVHQDAGVNQLMAQMVESQKSMMKEMSKMKKNKKSKKRKSKYYSDSDSSDSD